MFLMSSLSPDDISLTEIAIEEAMSVVAYKSQVRGMLTPENPA